MHPGGVIEGNPYVMSLRDTEQVAAVGSLTVASNPVLPACEAEALLALDGSSRP